MNIVAGLDPIASTHDQLIDFFKNDNKAIAVIKTNTNIPAKLKDVDTSVHKSLEYMNNYSTLLSLSIKYDFNAASLQYASNRRSSTPDTVLIRYLGGGFSRTYYRKTRLTKELESFKKSLLTTHDRFIIIIGYHEHNLSAIITQMFPMEQISFIGAN